MNVLLNLYNFQEDWAYNILQYALEPDMKVCLLPLSFHEDWVRSKREWNIEYGPKSHNFLEFVEAYGAYGIPKEQIVSVNYFKDSQASARAKVENADVLFFTGGFPDKMMARLQEMELVETIQNFQGIVMGSSAGAMIQFDVYHISEDKDYDHFQYHEGLGLLHGFEVEVHYEGSDIQNAAIERVMEERGVPVLAVGNQGGVLIDDGEIVPMGDVTPYGFDDGDWGEEHWEEDSEQWNDKQGEWQEEGNENWNNDDQCWEQTPGEWQNENQ